MITDVQADRAATPARAATRRPWMQAVVVAACFVVVYFMVGNQTNPYFQPVLLADAFLDGRLYIENPPDYLEMARYDAAGAVCDGAAAGCRGYVIEPPVPAVLLVLFVVLFGPELNLVLVANLFAAAAMGLFWVATRRLGWDRRFGTAMTVLVGLGTNFWWVAGDGALWTFAHVVAVFFLMAALVEATGRRRPWLVGLLVGLAGLSRLPVFLAFGFFLYLVLSDDVRWSMLRDRAVWAKVLQFGTGLGAMASVVPVYNFVRFGTIADAGYDHPQYAELPIFADGRFSISYIPRSLDAIFLAGPQVTEGQFPFFAPSSIGMALFMVTPAFLLAFAARRGRLEIAAAVAVAMVAVPHVLYGAIGFGQFGHRYSLDYLPMLAVLTASGMGRRVGIRSGLLIGLSVLIAVWGPLFFSDTRLEDVLGVEWVLPG